MFPETIGVPKHEVRRLWEYELAREALMEERMSDVTRDQWVEITQGYFPNFPYMEIDQPLREDFWKSAKASGHGFFLWRVFSPHSTGFHCDYEFALRDEVSYAVEEAGREAAAEKAAQFPDLNLGDFSARTNRSEMAANKKKGEFVAELGRKIYDYEVCFANLTIDLRYQDRNLIEGFEEMLTEIRKIAGDPTIENRGKRGERSKLKELAASRLLREFGTVEKAEAHLDKRGHELPYKDEGSWKRARQRVLSECSERYGRK